MKTVCTYLATFAVLCNGQTCPMLEPLKDAISSGGDHDLSETIGVVLAMGSKTAEPDAFIEASGLAKEDAIEPIFSASKFISAVLTMRAMEETDLFSLDTKVSDYIDWWTKDKQDPRSGVTVRHLLSMTSGFGRDFDMLNIAGSCTLGNGQFTQEECAKIAYNESYGKMDAGWMNFHDVAPEDVVPGKYFFYGQPAWNFLVTFLTSALEKGWNEIFDEYIGQKVGVAPSCRYMDNLKPGPNVNIDAGASFACSGEDVANIVGAYYTGNLVSQDSINEIEKAQTLEMGASMGQGMVYPESFGMKDMPTWEAVNVDGKNYVKVYGGYGYMQYGLGVWRICREVDCTDPPVVTSSGAEGFLPIWDRAGDFYAVVARANFDRGATQSENQIPFLLDELTKLYGGSETPASCLKDGHRCTDTMTGRPCDPKQQSSLRKLLFGGTKMGQCVCV